MKNMKTKTKSFLTPETKSNMSVMISILVAGFVIAGAIYFSNSSKNEGQGTEEKVVENVNNVSIVDGKQIIEIKAKGGFNPTHSIAKAGIPTVLRMNTNGTFDCTSIVRIPKLNISQNLPISGSTDIDLGTQKVAVLQGTCGMGMYPFDITFQ